MAFKVGTLRGHFVYLGIRDEVLSWSNGTPLDNHEIYLFKKARNIKHIGDWKFATIKAREYHRKMKK